MIEGRNYWMKSPYPFTANQWQELEQQALVYRYLVSGVPVPPDLFSTVTRTPFISSSSSLYPQQQALPIGWGCFQVGFGRKVDPEPGRCRRTDGKKWRCSKEAFPDSKYCERHMHRGKSKAKKQFEALSNSTTNTTTSKAGINNNNNIPSSSSSSSPTTTPSPTMKTWFSSSPPSNYAHKTQLQAYQTTYAYPFLSPHSSSFSTQQSPISTLSAQNHSLPSWLLDSDVYDQPKKDIRYFHEMKGVAHERSLGAEASKMNVSFSSGCPGLGFQDIGENIEEQKKEDETQKPFHHFLGDWPMKSTDSWVDYDHSKRSYKSPHISSQVSS